MVVGADQPDLVGDRSKWNPWAVPSKKLKPLRPARETKRLRRACIGSTLESLFDELGEGEEFRRAVREKVRSLDTARPKTATGQRRAPSSKDVEQDQVVVHALSGQRRRRAPRRVGAFR